MKRLLVILLVFCGSLSYSQSHDYFIDRYHFSDSVISFETKAGLHKDFLVEFDDKYLLIGFVDESGYIRSLLFCEKVRTSPDGFGVDAMPIGANFGYELNRRITSYSFDTNKKILRLEFDDSNYAVMRTYGDDSQINWEYGEHNTTRYLISYKF